MDLSQLETYDVHLAKPKAGPAVSVRISGTVKPGLDVSAVYQDLKRGLLAHPALEGLVLEERGEDVNLNPGRRSISGTFRFAPPRAPK